MKKSIKIKNERKIFSLLPLSIEVYLFLPKSSKAIKTRNLRGFFDQLPILVLEEGSQVFLNKQNAWQHGRFLQKNFLVLRAFVPHTAIQGKSEGLTLKKNSITKAHIHGYFPNLAKNNLYIENPYFEDKYYPPFLHDHDERKEVA